MIHSPAGPPTTTRTTYVAEIQDPITQEITVLEAESPEALELLVDMYTADPET